MSGPSDQIVYHVLDWRENVILALIYGYGDGYRYTEPEVATIFRVDRERVRQLHWQAVRKLAESACLCWECGRPAVVGVIDTRFPECRHCYGHRWPKVTFEETGKGRMIRVERKNGTVNYHPATEWFSG